MGKETVDPRELMEIIHYYSTYGDEAPENVKQADILRVANECIRLRNALDEVLSVDTSRIQRDSRSVVAIDNMKEAARKGIGEINNKMI
jgi:hypothetical protein